MNISAFISKRYLFAKKSQNIINIISFICIFGMAVSAAAMVIVLSAFNGIEELLEETFQDTSADIMVTPKKGKTFYIKNFPSEILDDEGVDLYSPIIEEVVYFSKKEKWVTATIKGVESQYIDMIKLGSYSRVGYPPIIEKENLKFCVMGLDLSIQLSAGTEHIINVNALNRNEKISATNSDSYNSQKLMISSIFSISSDFNKNYVFTHIDVVEKLLEYNEELTAYEINLKKDVDILNWADKWKDKIGEKYNIKTKFEKNALIFQTTQSEKRMVFIILLFVMVLVAFTMITAMTMLILEKKKDIFTLKSIGFSKRKVERVFINQGVIISVFSGVLGILLGILIVYLQLKFSLINIDQESFPVKMNLGDIIRIFLSIITIGLIASILPIKYLIRKLYT